MKKYRKKLLIIFLVFTIVFNASSITKHKSTPSVAKEKNVNLFPKSNTDIRVMTYNILSDSVGFDGFHVDTRKDILYDVLLKVSPDVLGLQEVCRNWHDTLKEWDLPLKFLCPVAYYLTGTMTTLLYNPERLNLLHRGTRSFSYSFVSKLRKYTWGVFEQKNTHKTFIVINTHLSLYEKTPFFPINQTTELIDFAKTLREKYNCPVFLVGDFNTKDDPDTESYSATYEYITLFFNDSRHKANSKRYPNESTINSHSNDYIFTPDDVTINSFTLLSQPELKSLSDHYPVFIDVNLE